MRIAKRTFILLICLLLSFQGLAFASSFVVPVIKSVELTPNNDYITVGDQVSLKVSTSSDVTEVYVTLQSSSGKHTRKVSLTYDAIKEAFVGDYTIQEYDENGPWIIETITLVNPNTFLFANGTGGGNDWSALSFDVYGNRGDAIPPTLDHISLSTQDVSIGESVGFTIKASDNLAGVEKASLKITGPTSGDTRTVTLNYNETKDEFSGSYTIDPLDEAGEWSVDEVVLVDKAANLSVINSTNFLQHLGSDFNLENLHFTVWNTTTDHTPPQLLSYQVIPDEVGAGEQVQILANVQDELTGVSNVWVGFTSPSGENDLGTRLSYDYNSGLYKGSISIEEGTEMGQWKLQNVYVEDSMGNSRSINDENENLYFPAESDWSNAGFTVNSNVVVNEPTDPTPSLFKISSINIAPDTVKSGSKVTMKVSVDHDLIGINRITASFFNPDTYKRDWISLYYNEEENLFEGSVTIDEFEKSGTWNLTDLEIEDDNWEYTTVDSENAQDYVDGDLQWDSLGYKVENPDQDDTAPQIESVSLNKKSFVLGDKVILTVKATDDKSGVSNVKAFLLPPNCVGGCSSENVYFQYNKELDAFVGEATIGNFTQSGEWKVSSVEVEDAAGNEQRLYENNSKDLLGENFTWDSLRYNVFVDLNNKTDVIGNMNSSQTWDTDKNMLGDVNFYQGNVLTLGDITIHANDHYLSGTIVVKGKVTIIDGMIYGNLILDGGSITYDHSDKTPPDPPAVEPINNLSTTLKGKAEPGSSIGFIFWEDEPSRGMIPTYSGGSFEYDFGQPLKEGTIVELYAYDKAGNKSASTKITVSDVIVPKKPIVKAVTDQTTKVTGTAEPKSTITIKNNQETIATGQVKDDGTFAIGITRQKAGSKLRVTSTDAGGNESQVAEVLVSDVTAPILKKLSVVSDQSNEINGITEANAGVSVTIGSKNYTTTADVNGNFKIAISKQTAGTEIKLSLTDGKNISKEKIIIVLDKTAPALPVVNSVSNLSKQVTGKAEAGSTVTVTIGTKKYVDEADEKGYFKVAIPVQKAGSKISVTCMDAAGNSSAVKLMTVSDKIAPSAPIVNSVSNLSKLVSGKAEAGSTVTIVIGTFRYTANADAKGDFKIAIPVQKAGTKFTVICKDKAGNASAAKSMFVNDKIAPAAPKITTVVKSTTTVVAGTAEANSTITIKVGTTIIGTAITDSKGNFKVKIKAQKRNTILSVYATDNSFNKSKGTPVKVL